MTDITAGDLSMAESTVLSAATGDTAAFTRLIAAHHATMARVAFVICGDPDATQDVLQAAWTIAWRRLGSLRDPSQVRAWLVAIAANEARGVMRRRRRERITDISDEVVLRDGGDPADALALLDLDRVLRGLTDDERALLAMRFAAGLDSAEIGTHLGISASGVRSRLGRLLDRLRADLDLDQALDEEAVR